MKKAAVHVTSAAVIAALKLRFPTPQFAFLEQVADGTGARQYRWADAVAMSVWPSRGYDIHGIEVKVSRYDWKKELDQPAKSAAVQQYCNRWWVAVGSEDIVQPGELPPTWGLLVLDGKQMKCKVEAPMLTPVPVTIQFVASVLRNMAASDDNKIENARRNGHAEGYRLGTDSGTKFIRDELSELKASLAEFETKSGIRIDRWSYGNVGEQVAILRGLSHKISQVRLATKACAEIKSVLEKVADLASLEQAAQP